MPRRGAAAKRVFSYEEAVALLPEVRRLTEEAYREVEALGEAAQGSSEEKVKAIVTAWAHAVMTRGVEVKGLWLVDFDNGSGYYCWRYPESGLQYYHSYEDGFPGRVRVH